MGMEFVIRTASTAASMCLLHTTTYYYSLLAWGSLLGRIVAICQDIPGSQSVSRSKDLQPSPEPWGMHTGTGYPLRPYCLLLYMHTLYTLIMVPCEYVLVPRVVAVHP